MYIKTELTEMETCICLLQMENGNGKLSFVCCKQKRKFDFLGRQTINSDQCLLFPQTCPSMPLGQKIIVLKILNLDKSGLQNTYFLVKRDFTGIVTQAIYERAKSKNI
jgi:hypothetical protein